MGLAAACALGAVALGAWTWWVPWHAAQQARALLPPSAGAPSTRGAGVREPAGIPPREARSCLAPRPSTLSGSGARMELRVNAISLRAPVLGSTSNADLARGVGHLPTSAWPDQAGPVVLEAHDMTFFSRLPAVSRGALIRLRSGCRSWLYRATGHRVVEADTPLTLKNGHLALITCWPTNALFATHQRYILTARPVATAEDASAGGLPGAAAPAPPALRPALPQGFPVEQWSASHAGLRLGHLRTEGSLSAEVAQSPVPYTVEIAAIHVFSASWQALTQDRPGWWSASAPAVPWARARARLAQRSPTGLIHVADVTVTGHGVTVTGATIRGSYRAVQGSTVHLSAKVSVGPSGRVTLTRLLLDG